MVDQSKEHRIFHQPIQKVGSWHRYQLYVYFVLSFVCIIETGIVFITPFIFYQSQYTCGDISSEQCNNFVCQLPISQRLQFLQPQNFSSLADSLGDFRCQNKQTLPLLQTIIFITSITGMISYSFFAQSLGRKKSLIIASTLIFIGLLIIFFSSTILMVIIGIIVTILGTQNANSVANCLPMEIVMESKRVSYSNALKIMYAVGIAMNGIAFTLLKDWKLIFVIFYIIPASFILFSAMFLLQKTPIDLLQSQQPREILDILQKIQKINGITQSQLSLNYITQLKIKYYYRSTYQHQSSFSIIDLFRYRSILKMLIPLLGNAFAAFYLFTLPAMINSSTSQEDLVNSNIISGISYAIAVIIIEVITHKLKRRTSIFIILLIGIITAIISLSANFEDKSLYKSAINLIERIMGSGLFIMQLLTIVESFPTQIRAVATLFIFSFGSLSSAFSPWVVQYLNSHQIDIKYGSLVIYFLATISTYFLKETFLIPPPDIIEELQQVEYQKDIHGPEIKSQSKHSSIRAHKRTDFQDLEYNS